MKQPTNSYAHCDQCNAVHPIHKLYELEDEDGTLLCYDCFHEEPRDPAYERAERSAEWDRRGGGGL